MRSSRSAVKLPEFFVFSKFFAIGFVCAEVFRIAFYLGTKFSPSLPDLNSLIAAGFITCIGIVLTYAYARTAHADCLRIVKSCRLDLLLLVAVGSWANIVASQSMGRLHKPIQDASPLWAPLVLVALLMALLSSLVRAYWPFKKAHPQLLFLDDEEISTEEQDVLGVRIQAKTFAETVLASAAHSGLVFGVDGPWGVGKTSFVKLAENHWNDAASDSTIVFRFELLRYAAELDLPQRFMSELSATIQKHAFAPEFGPLASRYSKMLKGKAELSFFGMKYSLDPSDETIDEMLQDIDDVLKRIRRRVIIIIDDLDRLEVRAINNVLFAVRRTFRLSQATYILCYDTEVLVGSEGDNTSARLFLEKFVTVKLSLFVDSSAIKNFLERDWSSDKSTLQTIPSDTMLKLSSILGDVAAILGSELASRYTPLIGDMRKVKRFVNAVLLMQIERTDLARTDFNRRDLINLMLLHLNLPGLFRQIYVEETEGRSGSFSVTRGAGKSEFSNSLEFIGILGKQPPIGQFLLSSLFDVSILNLNTYSNVQESALSSRACFNQDGHRNLEKYLNLIVRFVSPEPQETFVLYQKAVDRVRGGASIRSILGEREFRLDVSDQAHDQFWRVLVNQAHDFAASAANDAIGTLIDYLPLYTSVGVDGISLRDRSIYSLVRLLDNAGWGRTTKRRLPNSPKNIVEVAHRIFGAHNFKNNGILGQLCAADRGVLGLHDLMLFRLNCSGDRGGQLYNVQSALILYEDISAPTTGLVSELAEKGMRHLSQETFRYFKEAFIQSHRNFFTEVDETPDAAFFGSALADSLIGKMKFEQGHDNSIAWALAASRSALKSFVIYQLSNSAGGTGSGVGCGYYDEFGSDDAHGMAKMMNEYIFKFCFDPSVPENIYHFADHCLTHLSNGFMSGEDVDGYVATRAGLPGGFDPEELARYWHEHRALILKENLPTVERTVTTPNYTATYGQNLSQVFAVLDAICEEQGIVV
jgi:KAP family P-loop domain